MRSTDPDDYADPGTFKDNAAYVRAVHDRGLAFDLATVNRRRMLALFGGGLFVLAGCATSGDEATGATATPPTPTAVATATATATPTASATAEAATIDVDEVPDETGGPFPADGSNGPDVLTESGIVRSDITTSFGATNSRAAGVPTTIKLTVADADSDAPLIGAAVYLWHCDQLGRYSLYSSGVEDENYLRGVQETDKSGTATFTSVFPACYSGRWPHIHFEVYDSLTSATSGSGQIVKTSQMALPEDACQTVFASDGYGQSVQNLSQTSLESDNVFGDDEGVDQLATVTGDLTGMTLALTVGV
jgi:protocatechuate 3,4-dioxygenase beta subunit